jgi:diacylglycerol kinase family enzyme
VDLIRVDGGPPVANAVVAGVPPSRLHALSRANELRVEADGREVFAGAATTVVVANGQFLDGLDAVPRGHPGDGRLEVQVYALRRGERRAMRRRLPQGAHVPHPRIVTATARSFSITAAAPLPWSADGVARPPAGRIAGAVVAGAYRILI